LTRRVLGTISTTNYYSSFHNDSIAMGFRGAVILLTSLPLILSSDMCYSYYLLADVERDG